LAKKRRKNYSREFKKEAVALITDKGYSIAEASRNLGVEYSVLRRWKMQLADDPQNAFPGKGRQHPADQELRNLKKELERVKEERDILKKALAYFAEDRK
jgi:transposase